MIRALTVPGDSFNAMVFLHGMGSAGASAFADVATDPAFDGRLRLLPDLLGFGFSDRPRDVDYSLASHADAVAGFLDDRELRDLDVVGHSMGGSIAIVLATRRPDLVRSLAVLEPNLVAWDGGASVRIARQTEDEFVDTGFDALVSEVDTEWSATLRVCDPIALHRSAVGLCTTSVLEPLLALTLPRAYFYGASTGAPDGVGMMMTSGIRVVEIADAGHNMMADNRSEVVDALSDVMG